MHILSHDLLQASCARLPIFPLPGVVFLPSTLLPLHVFEPRYRQLVDDVLQDEGVLAVPLLKPGWEGAYGGQPTVWPVAGLGRIVRHQRMPDGRYNMILLGLGRVRFDQELPTDGVYRVVQATLLDDGIPPAQAARAGRVVRRLRALCTQLATTSNPVAEELGRLVSRDSDDPVGFVHQAAHLVLRDPEPRQQYLMLHDIEARADAVGSALATFVASSQGFDA